MHIFSFVEECNADASRAMSHLSSSILSFRNCLSISFQSVLRNRDKLEGQETVERGKSNFPKGLKFPPSKHTGAMSKHLQMIHGSHKHHNTLHYAHNKTTAHYKPRTKKLLLKSLTLEAADHRLRH